MTKQEFKIVKLVSKINCFAEVEIISIVDSEEKAHEIVSKELIKLINDERKKFREGEEIRQTSSECVVSFNNFYSDKIIYKDDKFVGGEIESVDYSLNTTTVTSIFYV